MTSAAILVVALAIFGAGHARSPIPNTDMAIEDVSLTNDELSPYRLPTTTMPINYNLWLSPNFETFVYAGRVIIQVRATQAAVNQIVLHFNDMTVAAVPTVVYNGVNYYASHSFDSEYDFMYINLSSPMEYNEITPVVYTITIAFEAFLRTDMYGFYRSWYYNNGQLRWMGTTQFQATSARSAFPCYDEPKFKATFDISISRPVGYRSWSNMRLYSTETDGTGRELDTFYRTPHMSTYLLAFIVAEYDTRTVSNAQGLLTYEVIARPEALANGQGEYALEVGQELLAAMDAHTGINFTDMDPNIKMTQASIPDFSAGAMENWGLLTYREAYLMYDGQHTNNRYKQLIAYILSHEIAHMWFGNLVTCDWWEDLWLNEGFARYYQYFLTHWVETDMGFETRFITEQIHTSLLADSIDSAHPLSDPRLGSPASVSAHFSTITYNKGAAVIRMTEHLLGFEVHRQGLQNYLTARSYNTAVPTDLFSALDDIAASTGAIAQYGADFTIDAYYRSWTEQAGYPLLYVHVNHQTGDITIQQRRFDRNNGYSSIAGNWIIPITFASAGNPDFADTKPTHIIRNTISVINRGTVGDQWVILNKQQTGFYRINYDDYTWGLITLALRSNQRTTIHEYNRAQIVDDVFQLARAGLMSYTRAFNILSFLEFETEYAPWAAAVPGINWLRRRFAGTQQLAEFEAMVARWATNVMSELTYYPNSNETFMTSYLRSILAPVMCGINVQACRTEATNQFVALRDNAVEVPADSRSWVYCNALRNGVATDFTFLWNRFQTHHVYTEKIVLLENLGCTSNAASLAILLDGITAVNYIIRPQDYNTAMNSAISGNEDNTQIVFTWIQNNWNQYSIAFTNVAGPLSNIAARLLNEAQIVAFETWANTNQVSLGNSYNAVVNSANSARQMITWTSSVAADVSDFLENGYQVVTVTDPPEEPVTDAPVIVLPPEVDPPITPDITDGAVSTTASICTVLIFSVGVLVNSVY